MEKQLDRGHDRSGPSSQSSVTEGPCPVSHTPGPWVTVGDGEIGELEICPAGRRGSIASIMFDDRDETTPQAKEKLANAHLIAAAPDLLEALKTARECIAYCRRAHKDPQSGEGFPVEMILDATIAKAEGRI